MAQVDLLCWQRPSFGSQKKWKASWFRWQCFNGVSRGAQTALRVVIRAMLAWRGWCPQMPAARWVPSALPAKSRSECEPRARGPKALRRERAKQEPDYTSADPLLRPLIHNDERLWQTETGALFSFCASDRLSITAQSSSSWAAKSP